MLLKLDGKDRADVVLTERSAFHVTDEASPHRRPAWIDSLGVRNGGSQARLLDVRDGDHRLRPDGRGSLLAHNLRLGADRRSRIGKIGAAE